jgi:hypothetical protein
MESASSAPRARFAYKRLLQIGSAAAALGSIVGLFLTVGDHARSFLGSNPATGVHLEKVALEPMPFRTYLKTRENEDNLTGLGYSRKDLAADVLAVDYDARFKGWSKGATFPVKLTLQARDAAGRPKALAEHDMKETLDARDDSCGCHSFFFVPKRGVTYRVSVQILRPGAPDANPLQSIESTWYRA